MASETVKAPRSRNTPTSTVGRGRAIKKVHKAGAPVWSNDFVKACHGDSLDLYKKWDSPTAIISDGAYGVLGFEGDTSDHLGLPDWYEPHIKSWAELATPQTTLWFWNSEIGWASVHPILEKYGWKYVNANVWNKGKGHIAGNVNTKKIRRFPVVTEVCVQYVLEPKVNGTILKKWLHSEWKRSGLRMRLANDACDVKDVATRKYLDQGHLWYYPPPDMFEKMSRYANKHGADEGKPYFSLNGKTPGTSEEWSGYRSKFNCPHGVTNVWDRPALRGAERFKASGTNGKAIHLNQKPLDLISQTIEASTDKGDVVWEPFGGLFTVSIASSFLKRRAFGAEIDETYFHFAKKRLTEQCFQEQLL